MLSFILDVIVFSLRTQINCQDYQLMYEPLYPSGSNRMSISDYPSADGANNFYNTNNEDLWKAYMIQTTVKYANPNVSLSTPPPDVKKPANASSGEVIPGLNGEPCSDMYPECPDFKENHYCKKYRKQMMFQCRKSCNFCDIDPYATEEGSGMEEEKEDEEEEEETSGEEENSGKDEPEIEDAYDDGSGSVKREVIPIISEQEHKDINQILLEDEKHFDRLKSRFKIPGLVPSLEDLYAEIGTIHPSIQPKPLIRAIPEHKKRSKISSHRDPFKYLKNIVGGSSIHPIVDTNALSSSRVQRSNPVYVFKTPRHYIAAKNTKRNIEKEPVALKESGKNAI